MTGPISDEFELNPDWREPRTGRQILTELERDGYLTIEGVEPVTPVWASALNRPDNLWFIFASPEDRELFEDELFLTWAQTDDRCVLLNYTLRWRDVQGWGVEITHADWAGPAGRRDLSMTNRP